jgi:hypothetical protein
LETVENAAQLKHEMQVEVKRVFTQKVREEPHTKVTKGHEVNLEARKPGKRRRKNEIDLMVSWFPNSSPGKSVVHLCDLCVRFFLHAGAG